MNASVREFRSKLKYYLGVVNGGEQLTLISRSSVVARIVPPDAIRVLPSNIPTVLEIGDGRIVHFRMFSLYEDASPLQDLQHIEIEFYGENPASYFSEFDGEFWVAELDSSVIAYGGWRPHSEQITDANLEHIVVDEAYRAAGVGQRLDAVLKQRAERSGYALV